MTGEPARVRQMWHLLEPLHAVLYYAPAAFEEAAALGYDTEERWASYFAWRAAPLGAAGADEVVRTFHSFAPRVVDGHVPAGWAVADPDAVLAARLRAVDRTYRELFGDRVEGAGFAEAAALARRAAEAAAPGVSGGLGAAKAPGALSGLGAANSALPWPDAPHLALWQAATVLREHRGDGHIAALTGAGLDPVEALVSFAAVGAAAPEVFASRGWSAEEWGAARRRLQERGLLAADGTATDAGRELRAKVELRTDEEAAAPWRALGATGRERLAELLGEPWLEVIGSGLLPSENTLGIGKV
ncbi:SCO6745 family protein [Streptomyces parvus]|uniref:SCO6745 family protein n=1 Tax=Streptomyces parvus TaxID=66428 RepID=UPI0035D7A82F